MYREDYARAGYCVLPPRTKHWFLAWQTLGPSPALVFRGPAAVAAGNGCVLHYFAAALLASGVLYYAFQDEASAAEYHYRQPRDAEAAPCTTASRSSIRSPCPRAPSSPQAKVLARILIKSSSNRRG
jgi:hypothetical protein